VEPVSPIRTVGSIVPMTTEFWTVTRAHVEEDPNFRDEELIPKGLIRGVRVGMGLPDYTQEAVEEGFSHYWDYVDRLIKEAPDGKLDSIGWGGFPMSPQLGRPRCLELIEETTKRTGIPATCDLEGHVDCLRTLGFDRIAVASRWADDLNQKIVRYFAHAGIDVASITTAGQMAGLAFAMSLDMGIRLAIELSQEAMKAAPNAKALLLPGGTWHPRGVVPILEQILGVPVVFAGNLGAWQLIREGVIPPIKGWGTVLEHA
jgi:maleate cis-trans isomerase